MKKQSLTKEFFVNFNNTINLFFYNFFAKKVNKLNKESIDIEKDIKNKTNKENVAIAVNNLYMSYTKKGNPTIKNCTFNIHEGDFHIFIGQNGAGKSTIIRMLIGLNDDFSGQILISGVDSKEKNARESMIFVPDKPIFPSEFTTFDYLFLSCNEDIRKNKELLTIKIDEYLKEFDILEVRDKNPNFLSSGQKQKVLIIKILINKPKIIILDEPTSNLDSITRIQFLNKLKELSKNEEVTIFISTHILDEIKKYATAATFIDKGEIKWNGKIKNEDILEIHNRIYNIK